MSGRLRPTGLGGGGLEKGGEREGKGGLAIFSKGGASSIYKGGCLGAKQPHLPFCPWAFLRIPSMEGAGRSWKALEGPGRCWKVLEHSRIF